MGEAPEARDDRVVLLGVLHERRGVARILRRGAGRERVEEGQRALLLRRRLGVLEGEVEEGAGEPGHRAVVTAGDGAVGDAPRDGVGGEGPRAVAVHVARELVEQDDQREGLAGALLPREELVGRGRRDEVAEALGELAVEGRVDREPALLEGGRHGLIERRAAEPGGENRGRVGVDGVGHGVTRAVGGSTARKVHGGRLATRPPLRGHESAMTTTRSPAAKVTLALFFGLSFGARAPLLSAMS